MGTRPMTAPPATALPLIAPLTTARPEEVEALLDAAFGADRHGRTAYRIRAGASPLPHLSFAAFDQGGALIGSLQSWPVALDGRVPLVLVGPVAVRPDLQRGGIGRALMARMIATADASGSDPMVLIGDPEYYDRFFGFDPRWTAGWDVPGPVERHRLLARVAPGVTLPATGMLGPRPGAH